MTDSPLRDELPAEDRRDLLGCEEQPDEDRTDPQDCGEEIREKQSEPSPLEDAGGEEPPRPSAAGEETEETDDSAGGGDENDENSHFCPSCGKKIKNTGNYCQYCGAELRGQGPDGDTAAPSALSEELPDEELGDDEPGDDEPGDEEPAREETPLTGKEKWKRVLRVLGVIFTTLGLLALLAIALALMYFHKQSRELRDAAEAVENLSVPAARAAINYSSPIDPERLSKEGEILFVSDELIAVAGAGSSYTDIERFFAQRDISVVGYLELADVYQLRLREPCGLEELAALARELEEAPEIDCAAVNLAWEPRSCAAPAEPQDGEDEREELSPDAVSWGLSAIRAQESWERFDPGTVRVGVMDIAFDPLQRDLRYGKVLKEGSGGNSANPKTGTALAAVLGAVHDNGIGVDGAAEDCLIYARGCDACCSQMDLLGCVAVLASDEVRVTVFGIAYPEEITEALAGGDPAVSSYYGDGAARLAELGLGRLLENGKEFLLVLPAGDGVIRESAGEAPGEEENSEEDEEKTAPEIEPVDARYSSPLSLVSEERIRDRILVVGAAGLDEEGGYCEADFSNRGERVDLLAPGVGVGSLGAGGAAALWNGSAMAAGYAAGICAQAWMLDPALSGAELRDLMIETAESPVPGGSAGMADMAAALERAEASAEALPVRPDEEAALDAYAELIRQGVKLQGRKAGILLTARHYLLLDMNGDGVQELLLYALDEDDLSASFALYSYKNGELVALGNAWETCRFAAWSNMNLTLQVCEGRFLYAEASRNSEGYGETGERFWLSYNGYRLRSIQGDHRREDGEVMGLIENSKITDQGIRIGSARDSLWER